ncbi:MAG: cytochrome b [Luteimonas sp.]
MTLKNPGDRWGHVSQLFHWLIVVLIVVMAWLGLTMTDLPNNPYKIRLYALHKSIGLSLLALVILRLMWRACTGAPRPLPGIVAWQERVASLTHFAMYVLLFAIPLSGWIFNSAAGFPMQWFGVVNLPALTGRSTALRELSGTWHELLFWALIVLALVHAAAAIHHHLFQHDATLARMLPRNWLRIPDHPQETSDV